MIRSVRLVLAVTTLTVGVAAVSQLVPGLHTASSTSVHGQVSAASSTTAPVAVAGLGPGLHLQVLAHGVIGATQPAASEMQEIFAGLGGSSVSRLQHYVVELEVIPRTQKLTDLPDFSFLLHSDTFDGRSYSTLRAVGPTADGNLVMYAVGEEQIVPGEASTYGPGFAIAHETGHVVRRFGLSASEDDQLRNLYAARHAGGGPWLTGYAGSNEDEYFADGTAAFFGHPWSADTSDRFSRSWLAANDPGLFGLLREVYAAA